MLLWVCPHHKSGRRRIFRVPHVSGEERATEEIPARGFDLYCFRSRSCRVVLRYVLRLLLRECGGRFLHGRGNQRYGPVGTVPSGGRYGRREYARCDNLSTVRTANF